jgi:hypothetical protein
MNFDAAEFRVALIDYFSIPVLKGPLPEAFEKMHHSANNTMAHEMAETFWYPCIIPFVETSYTGFKRGKVDAHGEKERNNQYDR